jgi:phosphoglycolate phosphatase-like HAD superfamily hydrolase
VSRQADGKGVFQFGGGTAIPPDIGLIVLDCYETLVELDGTRYLPRNGVRAFLDHFALGKGIPVAVLSDGEQSEVERVVAGAGIAERIAVVFGAPDSIEPLAEGRTRKRLDLPPRMFGVEHGRCVYIGDTVQDGEAARHHRIPFIRVPRSEDRAFSFACLIGGPSRYQSSEFSAVFLERYLGKKLK